MFKSNRQKPTKGDSFVLISLCTFWGIAFGYFAFMTNILVRTIKNFYSFLPPTE